ncbi:CsgG/HfaB family protein [Seohaeicola saemankumensis]|nr:CsgG/HfaB family protein [Seohaeicola saemankumensis]MCA0871440.1 CsgG/HfaB family protein [Seohaeicola saemankumensis]
MNEAEPIRVAVTAFVQSDRKTTQFTNLLMIALTGKMVQFGDGAFRVIERAQLETALAEIQLSDVPIFDRDTAQELGKFLGVDALIVGEITPLSDHVRLDARMIDVETIETVEQAYEWVPLTPTVQRQLETLAIVSRPRVSKGDQPDPRNGIWRGTGTCGDLTIGLAVSIIVTPDDKVSAMQTYYPAKQFGNGESVQSGTLAMAGTIDPATNEIRLLPGEWINQPRGHGALGFAGTLDPNAGVLTAQYDHGECGEINLRRMN